MIQKMSTTQRSFGNRSTDGGGGVSVLVCVAKYVLGICLLMRESRVGRTRFQGVEMKRLVFGTSGVKHSQVCSKDQETQS